MKTNGNYFLKAVFDYFLQHQNDNMRMSVNRNEITGEFQPLANEYHPVVTDLKTASSHRSVQFY